MIARDGLETDGTEQILEDEKKVRENAPKVMQDSIKDGQGAANAKPSGSRSFSTFARRRQEDLSSVSG